MNDIDKGLLDYQAKLKALEGNDEIIEIARKEALEKNAAEKKRLQAESKKEEREKIRLAKEAAAEERRLANVGIISDFITDNNLYQTGSGRISWWKQNDKGEWLSVYRDTLVGLFPLLADYSTFVDFTKLMNEKERVIDKTVLSWTAKTGNKVLNQLEKRFAEYDQNNSTDYHWMIDAVFKSISGGEQDAVENLEKTIYAKHNYPESFMLPNPFFNDNGETGKSLFVEQFLRTVFGGQIASNANMTHITGTFNKAVSGKAVVFVNETVKESVAVDKLKAFLGSSKIIVEEKFQPMVEADNTALLIGAANDKAGAIMLGGNKADRRFSIFSSKGTLNEIVLSYLVANNVEDFNIDSDVEKIRAWIKDKGQYLLGDTESVSKWLCAMRKKYGDVKNVEPFHGKDYKDMLDRQRPAWLDSVERVFTNQGFSYIRNSTLINLIRHFNQGERNIPGKKRMKDLIDDLIAAKKLNVVFDPVFHCMNNGSFTSATVWRIPSANGGRQAVLGEKLYGHEENNRWIWDWIE